MGRKEKIQIREIPLGGETLLIQSGRLGPLRPTTIDVRPLTLFVGQQGTGKSLLAQVLYFFRGLPNMAQFYSARRRPDEEGEGDPGQIAGRILDGLRSARRRFANLTRPNVSLHWTGDLAVGGTHAERRDLSFNTQYVTRQVQPSKGVTRLVEEVTRGAPRLPWNAVFVPTERLFYSMALGPSSLGFIGAPMVMEVFAHWMDLAGTIQEDWPDGRPDTEGGRWVQDRLSGALAGQAVRRAGAWRWVFQDGGETRSLDLDMASSGQRANWPIALIPEVLFSLRRQGELAEGFTLYLEEPEIHLHPEAQRAVVEVLAYLVVEGFRVVLTTHSLTVVYALNNLLLAGRLPEQEGQEEVERAIRLHAGQVAAYRLLAGGDVEPLVDEESGLISEAALGSVADAMASQMNRLYAATPSRAGGPEST